MLAVVLGAMVAPAAATTFTPNRFDDPSSGGTNCGPPAAPHGCSLRGALAAPHTGDIVQLKTGTYLLSIDELLVTHAMTIIGGGPPPAPTSEGGVASLALQPQRVDRTAT